MPVHHFRVPLSGIRTAAKFSLRGKSHPEMGSPSCGPIAGTHYKGKKLPHNPSSILAPPYNQTQGTDMHAHSYSHAGLRQPGQVTSGKESRISEAGIASRDLQAYFSAFWWEHSTTNTVGPLPRPCQVSDVRWDPDGRHPCFLKGLPVSVEETEMQIHNYNIVEQVLGWGNYRRC